MINNVSGVHVPRVRPYLGRLWYGWLDQHRLYRAAGLVPKILARVPPIPGVPGPTDWVLQRSLWSETGVAVMLLGPESQPPVAVLKAAHTSAGIRGLRTQASVLARLRADARLGDWRRMLPRTVAEGEAAGFYYTVQEALPGVEAQARTAEPESRPLLLSMAAAAVRSLHERTSERAVAAESFLARAVDLPIELIRGAARSELSVRREKTLPRLTRELRGALEERAVCTSWIHGDFWLGNVLVTPEGAEVTGIVDWSMAARHELPLHDVLHLIVYMRQVAQRCELGDAVRALLDGANWEPHERALLEAEELGLPASEAGQRLMLLLYWLRRLKAIIEQDRGQARNPVWVAWNIDRVLQCL